MKTHKDNMVSLLVKAIVGGGLLEAAAGCGIRSGGMFFLKRNPDSNQNSNPVPNIKVKVKYGSCYDETIISSQASFHKFFNKRRLEGNASRALWIACSRLDVDIQIKRKFQKNFLTLV